MAAYLWLLKFSTQERSLRRAEMQCIGIHGRCCSAWPAGGGSRCPLRRAPAISARSELTAKLARRRAARAAIKAASSLPHACGGTGTDREADKAQVKQVKSPSQKSVSKVWAAAAQDRRYFCNW